MAGSARATAPALPKAAEPILGLSFLSSSLAPPKDFNNSLKACFGAGAGSDRRGNGLDLGDAFGEFVLLCEI